MLDDYEEMKNKYKVNLENLMMRTEDDLFTRRKSKSTVNGRFMIATKKWS